ncbi:heavy-metal-associated domain-containing protein [Clostridium sp. MSJ-4]|uniref:Heavy-metal-associated domain-containing protein n=1 Tax=Clostridium simiarum TaxID=2841506 RepID=A0ABS6EZQ4_9CLOT|nr:MULTISPECIES: heavy-metal-associated domain-containing protein [Clostridium]MBU5591703.1 heavy-metal-associated domain-containing protein [Clostridium simiarum]
MKATIKVCNMNTNQDVDKVKKAIAQNEGVIACEITKDKGEIQIVYDNYFVTVEDIIESIEDMGYTVLE